MSVRTVVAAAALFVLLLPAVASAFGSLGHQTAAEIAARHLTPAAAFEIQRLLHDRPSNAMRQASTWADEVKRDGGTRTGALHYTNLDPQTCAFRPHRDCPDGRCIVDALAEFAAVLVDRTRPDDERADALRWVIHLVADVAQPLHAYGPKGGLEIQVRFRGRGTNLHHIWDSTLLEEGHLSAIRYADALERERPPPPNQLAWSTAAPQAWAEESCRLLDANAIQGGEIDAAYVDRYAPVAERQVRIAGLRLANVLNAVLGR